MPNKRIFTHNEIEQFKSRGFVICRDIFTAAEKEIIRTTANEIQQAPETAGKWMKYFETNDKNEDLLNRVEDFTPYWPELDQLVRGERIAVAMEELTSEKFILLKEKINFKLPNGGGFQPHQDGPAFTRFCRDLLITAMVAVDETTVENGCLQVANRNFDGQFLPHPTQGTIESSILADLAWEDIPMHSGDIIFFSSYLPHRSHPNMTTTPRRAYFFTYNKAKHGDLREECLNYKRSHFPPRIERKEGVSYETWQKNLARPLK